MGARIGYYQGDVKKLVDDIAALKPTLFIGAHGFSLSAAVLPHIVKAGAHFTQYWGKSMCTVYVVPALWVVLSMHRRSVKNNVYSCIFLDR